jgi:hypothetical protein
VVEKEEEARGKKRKKQGGRKDESESRKAPGLGRGCPGTRL